MADTGPPPEIAARGRIPAPGAAPESTLDLVWGWEGALLGAFGVAAAAWLTAGWLGWLTATVLIGALYAKHRPAAFAGIVASAIVFRSIDYGLGPYPPDLFINARDVVINVLVAAGCLLAPLGIWLGGFARHIRGMKVDDRTSILAQSLRGGALVLGIVAAVGTAVSFAVLVAVPGSSSFQVLVPPGWSIVSRERVSWGEAPWFGNAYTAVLGQAAPQQSNGVASSPVVGISVVRYDGPDNPADCLRASPVWGGYLLSDSDEIIASGAVGLPVGDAYEVVLEIAGSRVYAYTTVRARRVGLVIAPQCYLVVIHAPAGSGLTAESVRPIIDSFRYR
jgi:hypothetical protein